MSYSFLPGMSLVHSSSSTLPRKISINKSYDIQSQYVTSAVAKRFANVGSVESKWKHSIMEVTNWGMHWGGCDDDNWDDVEANRRKWEVQELDEDVLIENVVMRKLITY